MSPLRSCAMLVSRVRTAIIASTGGRGSHRVACTFLVRQSLRTQTRSTVECRLYSDGRSVMRDDRNFCVYYAHVAVSVRHAIKPRRRCNPHFFVIASEDLFYFQVDPLFQTFHPASFDGEHELRHKSRFQINPYTNLTSSVREFT